MTKLRKYLDEWTRVSIYILLVLFGAYSTIYPIVSLDKAAPFWAEILLGSEFIAAGILLIMGMNGKRRYRYAGLLVVAIGLFTISGLIAFVGGSRVLSYAFLFGAFGMQSVDDLREEKRRRTDTDTESIRRELVELSRANHPGEQA